MRALLTACLLAVLALSLHAKEEQRKCPMGRDYSIFIPDNIDKNKTYWLVVGVHGASGNWKDAAGLAGWVSKYDNVIVVGPSFPLKKGYQMLGGDSDKQLLDLFTALSNEFKLRDKMFVFGFSGGSQYAHRFVAKHFKKVIGVASHSGGTWEDAPSSESDVALWTISCGLKDTEHSAGAPLTRIEYFRKFCDAMLKKSFTVKPFVTDAGHAKTKEVFKATEECFRVATTGIFDYQREAIKDMSIAEREKFLLASYAKLKDIDFNDGNKVHKLKVNKDGWTISIKALKAMEETRKENDKLKAK